MPWLVWTYPWQEETTHIDGGCDANVAGCKSTRRSTSGGAISRGKHCLRTWSKTQACVTLSSAESELLGAVRGGVEALGMTALFKDFGQDMKVALHMDASAALGVIQRKGVGKVRHLDVSTLWLQEQQLRETIEFRKIHGLKNAADLLTKNVPKDVMVKHVDALGLEWRIGRSTIAAQLHAVEEGRKPRRKQESKKSLSTEALEEGKDSSEPSRMEKSGTVRHALMSMIALNGSSAPGKSKGDRGIRPSSKKVLRAAPHEEGRYPSPGKEAKPESRPSCGGAVSKSRYARVNPESRPSCGGAVSKSRNAQCEWNRALKEVKVDEDRTTTINAGNNAGAPAQAKLRAEAAGGWRRKGRGHIGKFPVCCTRSQYIIP